MNRIRRPKGQPVSVGSGKKMLIVPSACLSTVS